MQYGRNIVTGTKSFAKSDFQRRKRVFDVFFSCIGLIVLAPIFLLIFVAIRLTDHGPVFYRQRRVGLNGTPFDILKFRTMVVNADKIGPSVTQGRDPRITRIGRILRQTKLDELPQLWNVLRGEMTFVGPRPEVPFYIARYTQEQQEVLKLKPGLTDLASLSFRNEEELLRGATDLDSFYLNVCVPKKVQLNLEYAHHASLFSDVRLIVRTIVPTSLGVLAIYGMVLLLALCVSVGITQNTAVSPQFYRAAVMHSLWLVSLQLIILARRKQHRVLLQFFHFKDALEISMATGGALLLALCVTAFYGRFENAWIYLLCVDTLFATIGLLTFRSALGRSHSEVEPAITSTDRRVAIVGAGDAGAGVAVALAQNANCKIQAFFDDDPRKWHKFLHGVMIAGMPECLIAGWQSKIDEVIVAMPSAPTERLFQISNLVRQAGKKLSVVPSH
jgi:lipopolysaccharide/colanic/teichoic acid biosynthesis glycosyltransferase